MSQACISYGSLKEASSEASQVAKKLDKYANNLDSQIYKQLNCYSGSYTTNISQAKSNVNSKISDLRSRSTAYSTYSQDLLDLKEQCVSTDKAVKSNVSKLTSSFKSANGIRDSKVQNSINYFLTSIGNSTYAGRWLGNKKDEFGSAKDYIKQSLEDWWDYEGGAELVKGVLVGILEVAIAVVSVGAAVFAFMAGGALLVLIAACVAGAIALVNGVVNIANEVSAYKTTHNGDPATGSRRGDVNTLQDYLRSSFIYGSDGESYEYDPTKYAWATGIDIVNVVCTVVTVVDSAGKLIKNCYQWATTTKVQMGNFKSLGLLFSKEGQAAFWSKTGSCISKGWHEVSAAIKMHDFQFFATTMTDFVKTDFLVNMKSTFFNFDTEKDGFSSIKQILSFSKDILKDGITMDNIAKYIVFPGITIMNINTISEGPGGQLQFDFQNEHVTLDKVTGIVDKVHNKIFGGIKFESSTINSDILGKLSTKSTISVSIPEIKMPNISIDYLQFE
ncbi:MAG: hypothetical protein ACI4E1_03685 [Lachnospira sp.]